MSYFSFSSSTCLSSSSQQQLDHHGGHHHHNQQQVSPSESDHLCYVHCNLCDTVLAVNVPCSSLFKSFTVRCGHCTNLLPVVNLQFLLPPHQPSSSSSAATANQFLHHYYYSPFLSQNNPLIPHNLLIEDQIVTNPNPSFLINQPNQNPNPNPNVNDFNNMPVRVLPNPNHHDQNIQIPRPPPTINRPPEKRQRVPSAYNRFIKEEIQRIKSANPDISHREAFSAAAKNWAHFPHIHLGVAPDQTPPAKKTTLLHQEGDGVMMMKDGRSIFHFN